MLWSILSGPGMDKKYDGNTLWSTFYCLEDMIHGAGRNNISIDMIMSNLSDANFLLSKNVKKITTFSIPILFKSDSLGVSASTSSSCVCLGWVGVSGLA